MIALIFWLNIDLRWCFSWISTIVGYFFYFVLALLAACKDWPCWSSSCGFIVMGMPSILITDLISMSRTVKLWNHASFFLCSIPKNSIFCGISFAFIILVCFSILLFNYSKFIFFDKLFQIIPNLSAILSFEWKSGVH